MIEIYMSSEWGRDIYERWTNIVINGKFSVKIIMSLLIVSLISTSLGGAFATAALAASPEEESERVESGGKIDNAIIGGLLAIGLLTAISGGKKSGASDAPKSVPSTSAPAKSTPSQSSPSTIKPATSTPSSYSGLTADEQKAISLMNADRAASGLPALKVNSKLVVLARDYAQDMINRDYFSHYNPEGQSPFDRMNKYGIRYSYAGENLAINRSVEAAEKAFMNSAGHRANILNPNYTEIGIGVKYEGNTVYVVQEFIKP